MKTLENSSGIDLSHEETSHTVIDDRQRIRNRIRMRRAVALLFSFAVIGLIIAVPLRTYYSTWQMGRELVIQNRQLENEINQLSKEQQEHNDPAWIQAQARSRLLMGFPGEYAYRFEKPSHTEFTDQERKQLERDNHAWYATLWNDMSIPN